MGPAFLVWIIWGFGVKKQTLISENLMCGVGWVGLGWVQVGSGPPFVSPTLFFTFQEPSLLSSLLRGRGSSSSRSSRHRQNFKRRILFQDSTEKEKRREINPEVKRLVAENVKVLSNSLVDILPALANQNLERHLQLDGGKAERER